jgi:isoquinoline 1-oxidoreductase beta subunit
VIEACEVAKQAKVPVKVVWTREDDIQGGYYRPMYVASRSRRGSIAGARIVGWNHAIVGPSILAGTAFEPMMVKDGRSHSSTARASPGVRDSQPRVLHTPTLRVDGAVVALGGHSHTGFVMETMVDEWRPRPGKDPLRSRATLLGKHRACSRCSTCGAARPGWGRRCPRAGRAGIAVVESFEQRLRARGRGVARGGQAQVHRVVAAFDCGLVGQSAHVEAQLQSAIAFGLSAALHGKITLKDGRVEQSNFHDYPVLRMDEMPRVEVHLVTGGTSPRRVGERRRRRAPAVATPSPLTGKRIRALPLADTKWTCNIRIAMHRRPQLTDGSAGTALRQRVRDLG